MGSPQGTWLSCVREWAKPELSLEGILEAQGGPSISLDFIATTVSPYWWAELGFGYLSFPAPPGWQGTQKSSEKWYWLSLLFLGAERTAGRWSEGYLIRVSPNQAHSEGSFGSTWRGHSCLLGTIHCLWPGGLGCGEAPVLLGEPFSSLWPPV